MVNEFHSYIDLEFNPAGTGHSSVLEISGDEWLVNIGMNKDRMAADVAILSLVLVFFLCAACTILDKRER